MSSFIQCIIMFSLLGLCLLALIITVIVSEIKLKKLDRELDEIRRKENL